MPSSSAKGRPWHALSAAEALRDGEVYEVDAEQVVLGDVRWLESANRVLADPRLRSVHGLEVLESLLTGEWIAVTEEADERGEVSTSVADRKNLAHTGTIIARRRAKGVVVATGISTAVANCRSR